MAPAKTGGSEEGAFGKKQKNPDTNPMKDVSWPGVSFSVSLSLFHR